jgi:hypothetical protein
MGKFDVLIHFLRGQHMANPTNRIFKFMTGKPAVIARRPRTGHPVTTEMGGQDVQPSKSGSHYVQTPGRTARTVNGQLLAKQAARHGNALDLTVPLHGVQVEELPVERPLFHQEIVRLLAQGKPVHPVLFSATADEGVQSAVFVQQMASPVAAGPVAARLTSTFVPAARVMPSSAEKMAALVTLAAEISVNSTAVPVPSRIEAAFHLARISGIGDLVYLVQNLPETSEGLKLFYRRFVLTRVESAVPAVVFEAFEKLVHEQIQSDEFLISCATALSLKKPAEAVAAAMTKVSEKPDFVPLDLTREQVLHLLMTLADAMKPNAPMSGLASEVADKLHALGFRNFETTLMLFVGYLPDNSDVEFKNELEDFVSVRLKRVLNSTLYDRFVIMLRSHEYQAFWQESQEFTDEAIWAVDAAPSSSGDTKGGQGHSRERQQAQDEESI